MHRVRGERAAGRVDRDAVAEAERVAQDELLVRERRVELGDVDAAAGRTPAFSAASAVERRAREVARAERVRLDAVIDAADPRRARAEPCARGRRRRARWRRRRRRSAGSRARAAARRGTARRAARRRRARLRAARRGCPRARRLRAATSAMSRSVRAPGVEQRARLERGEAHRVGPERRDVVGSSCSAEHVARGRPATTCRRRRRAPMSMSPCWRRTHAS